MSGIVEFIIVKDCVFSSYFFTFSSISLIIAPHTARLGSIYRSPFHVYVSVPLCDLSEFEVIGANFVDCCWAFSVMRNLSVIFLKFTFVPKCSTLDRVESFFFSSLLILLYIYVLQQDE